MSYVGTYKLDAYPDRLDLRDREYQSPLNPYHQNILRRTPSLDSFRCTSATRLRGFYYEH